MAVLKIEQYKQKNGEDILKVLLKPTKQFPNGSYFYADACDEDLVRNYTWFLRNRKKPYITAVTYGNYHLHYHREKAYKILGYYPSYINHVDGVEFDNINNNLDEVTNSQNLLCCPSKGYSKPCKAYRSFRPEIIVGQQKIRASCVKSEVDACQSVYNLELAYENYRYDFFKDRRSDLDLLDLERRGSISEEEAIYHHVLKYSNNAWYVYRYNLFSYFKENYIPVPAFSLDEQGYMIHPITGSRLCPL